MGSVIANKNRIRQSVPIIFTCALVVSNLICCPFCVTNIPLSWTNKSLLSCAMKLITPDFSASGAVMVAASNTAFSAKSTLRLRNCASVRIVATASLVAFLSIVVFWFLSVS
ncbi:Uncharacterised protein [Legionella adelaidensis]|uniref:Transmembrane protein n=1 Tax=Legionella adelaidensis TaxID=45056 RepID=A0A448N995_9GAMM|nr:Uncharacterised protein [Legionella adelaidensis]